MPSVSTQTEEPIKYRRRISYRQRFISRRRELHLRRIAYRPRVTHQKRPVKFEFPLADLCGELLEKIITKMVPRSYIRLQKACRDMNAFVRKSKNITVYMDVGFMEPSRFSTGKNDVIIDCGKEISLEGFYGIRLTHLHVNRENTFDVVCDILKKYRITVNDVLLDYSHLTRKQVQAFLEITKPTKISLGISHAYEILLQSKTLKNVKIDLEMDVVVDAMTKYLAKFSSVKLRLVHDTPMQLSLLRTVLKVLLSEYRPQLRYFKLFPAWELASIPPEVVVKQLFHCFNLKLVAKNYNKNVYEVEQPQHFPPDATCQITMGLYTCKIVYTCGPEAKE